MKKAKFLLPMLLLLSASCAKLKVSQNNTPNPEAPQQEQLHKELVSTDMFQTEAPENAEQFDSPKVEIKTKSGTLLLGQTKFSAVKYFYDQKQHTLKILGHLKIETKEKTILTENDFELNGKQNSDQAVIDMNDHGRKPNDPVIRAKVTCLTIADNEDVSCEKALVDFFVLFEKQYFTDQFETAQAAKPVVVEKPKTNESVPQILKTNEPIVSDKPAAIIEETDLQSEGTEESMDGRFQGQAETVDLPEFFKTESSDQTKAEKDPVHIQIEQPKTENKTQVLNTNFIQSSSGTIRPVNQAVGFPDNGTLRNATSLMTQQTLLKENSFYAISFPTRERFYSTFEMAQMISKMGHFLNSKVSDLKLFVGNISAKRGGHLNPHKSHQIGVDADIAYPVSSADLAEKTNFPVVVTQSNRQIHKQAYSVEKTFELFKFAFKQNEFPIDRIFVDRLIIQDLCTYAETKKEFSGADKLIVEKIFQNIEHVDGHGDHFHMRLKCSDSQPACRSKVYKKNLGCTQFK